MTLPVGVSTATVTVGTDLSVFGDDASISAVVTPIYGSAKRIVYAPTGQTFNAFAKTFTGTQGTALTFALPHVNQDGFQDGAGNVYKMWAYQIEVTVSGGGKSDTWTQNLQPLVGQSVIDLDLVPSGPIASPVSTPAAVVLSINGRTGIVSLDASEVDLDPVPGMTATTVQAGFVELEGLAGAAGFVTDTTAKSLSSTTLANDTNLAVPIKAGEVLWLRYLLTFSGPAAAATNLKAQLTAPAGAAAAWGPSRDFNPLDAASAAPAALAALADTRTFKLAAGVTGVLIEARVVNGATAGNVILKLAQNASNATPLVRDAYGKVTWERAA